jgi:hypothetical protein
VRPSNVESLGDAFVDVGFALKMYFYEHTLLIIIRSETKWKSIQQNPVGSSIFFIGAPVIEAYA